MLLNTSKVTTMWSGRLGRLIFIWNLYFLWLSYFALTKWISNGRNWENSLGLPELRRYIQKVIYTLQKTFQIIAKFKIVRFYTLL